MFFEIIPWYRVLESLVRLLDGDSTRTRKRKMGRCVNIDVVDFHFFAC